ncbi:MAG TPA: hypothetical protein VJT31_33680, partial [Rugosimonospora sp.]|nr:hypothetical protein [Rugosimonospora sp.]
LQALRDAAVRRLVPAFDLPADAAASAVVEAVAARTARTPEDIESILYGPEPPDDEALVSAVDALDTLMNQALGMPLRPAAMEGES